MTPHDITELEGNRLALQNEFDQARTAKVRNLMGQFATPPALAKEIVTYISSLDAFDTKNIQFLEPAFGTGSFYAALLQQFPRHTIQRSVGIEIDPQLIQSVQRLWADCGIELIEGDFTALKPFVDKFNLLITNPPYVRHHHLTAAQKAMVRSRVVSEIGISPSGLTGLYCYFVFLSLGWLADNALSVWLIPSEFMDVNYGDSLRLFLATRVQLIRIHRFSPKDAQFSDATVSSAVVVYRNHQADSSHKSHFTYGGSIMNPDEVCEVSNAELSSSRKWTSIIRNHKRSHKENEFAATLGDLFFIKRGIATGANNFFVMKREKAISLEIPDQFLRPYLPGPRHINSSIIESGPEGYPIGSSDLCLLDIREGEDVIRMHFPTVWNYLESGKSMELHRRYLAQSRNPWYAQEKRDPAPFLCTYMSRTGRRSNPFRFFWNQSQAIAGNVYLCLYPKPMLKRQLNSDFALLQQVLDFLLSIKADDMFGEGRVYGGGLHKMEPNELARVRCPRFDDSMRLF